MKMNKWTFVEEAVMLLDTFKTINYSTNKIYIIESEISQCIITVVGAIYKQTIK